MIFNVFIFLTAAQRASIHEQSILYMKFHTYKRNVCKQNLISYMRVIIKVKLNMNCYIFVNLKVNLQTSSLMNRKDVTFRDILMQLLT